MKEEAAVKEEEGERQEEEGVAIQLPVQHRHACTLTGVMHAHLTDVTHSTISTEGGRGCAHNAVTQGQNSLIISDQVH